jgi:hypothetical protein
MYASKGSEQIQIIMNQIEKRKAALDKDKDWKARVELAGVLGGLETIKGWAIQREEWEESHAMSEVSARLHKGSSRAWQLQKP